MTDVLLTPPRRASDDPPPARFRENDARTSRMGRPLRRVAGVRDLDEHLMGLIAARMRTRDEPGARLARAMRMRAGEPGRVSMAQFRGAIAGSPVPDDAPEALRSFFATVEATPAWLDRDLLRLGQVTYHRWGQNAADVLTQLSLVGGYRFGGPPDLLVATGGLVGASTRRRMAETQRWTTCLSEPGSLERDGEGWRLTVHVRAMHALVNHAFEPDWDVGRWGLPINQTDLAGTLGLFDGVVLLGVRLLGVPVTPEESRAVMHLWKYVGWLLGVDDDWLVDTERERHRLNYHLLRAQGDVTPAGGELARAIVEVQRERHFARWPRTSQVLARERLLSMLTVFLGTTSMRELGLPLRPPWAHPVVLGANAVRYRMLGRTPSGRRRLDAWGTRTRHRILASYYGPDDTGQPLRDLPG